MPVSELTIFIFNHKCAHTACTYVMYSINKPSNDCIIIIIITSPSLKIFANFKIKKSMVVELMCFYLSTVSRYIVYFVLIGC